MNCQDYRLMINKDLDGELPLMQQELLQRHLCCCPACTDYLAELREVDELLLEALAPLPQTPDLVASVMDALPQVQAPSPARIGAQTAVRPQRRRPQLSRTVLRSAVGVAAALLLFLGLSCGFSAGSKNAQPETILAAESEKQPGPSFWERLNLQNYERRSEDKISAEVGKSNEQSPADISGAQEGAVGSSENTDEDETVYINGLTLPAVAVDNEVSGSYQLTELAAFTECDALSPCCDGETVRFAVDAATGAQEWQVAFSGGTPEFVRELTALPAVSGRAESVERSEIDRETGEEIRLRYYEQVSISGLIARSSARALVIIRRNGSETEVAPAGGELLQWAPDGNKLFFSDAAGTLWLYYPTEDLLLEVFSDVNSACWCGSSHVVFSARGENGFSAVFRITAP